MANLVTATLGPTTGPVVLLLVVCMLLIAVIAAGLALLCRPVGRSGASLKTFSEASRHCLRRAVEASHAPGGAARVDIERLARGRSAVIADAIADTAQK